jgi:hypothetical protein
VGVGVGVVFVVGVERFAADGLALGLAEPASASLRARVLAFLGAFLERV